MILQSQGLCSSSGGAERPGIPVRPSRPSTFASLLLLANLFAAGAAASAAGGLAEADPRPGPRVPAAPSARQDSTPRTPPAPPSIDSREISFNRAVLANPTNPLDARRMAAARLLRVPSAAGAAAIAAVFESTPDAEQSRLMDVFRNAAAEDAELADALVMGIAYAAAEDRVRLFDILAWAGGGIDALVVAAATDPTRPLEHRRAAVEALGRIASRQAAEALLALVATGPESAEELRSAAFASLEQLSGMPLGEDVAAWRAWWEEQGDDLLIERTCEERAEALAARLGQAERERRAVDERAERTASRLKSALSEILLAMELAPRQERVRALLSDELATLRLFAVEQVERMLRNGDRVGDDMTLAMATLLDDASPILRSKATRLLSSLGWTPISDQIARRLPKEEDVSVAIAMLEVLAERPAEGSMSDLLDRMESQSTAEAAARAVGRLQAAGLAPIDWRPRAAEIAREALAANETASPPMARVLALAGDESDQPLLLGLLDGADPRVRKAIAEGWSRKGVLEPLEARSADPAVYAAVAQGILDTSPDLDGLDRVLALVRPAASDGDFEAVLMRFVAIAPATMMIEADRRLEAATAPSAVRAELLRRATTATDGSVLPEARRTALRRRAMLLLQLDRPEDAADLLAAEPILPEEPLFPILFEARLRAGRFERAATQRPEAEWWLAMLERFVEEKRELAAAALGAEIDRRFSESLSIEQVERLAELRGADAVDGAANPEESPNPPTASSE